MRNVLEIVAQSQLGEFNLDVNFTVNTGVTALFGRSGAGKSTIVSIIAGLRRPDKGLIRLGDRVVFDSQTGINLKPEQRRVGMVFQKPNLFPHMTVIRNLTYGIWAGRRATKNSAEQADNLDRIVTMLGISDLLQRYPGTLSGGEAQRAAIGRALLANPEILLLDEPLSALDNARKQEILPWLEALRDAANIPIIYVSHAIEEVARIADTVVMLDNGKVAAIGPVGEVMADVAMDAITGIDEAGAVLSAVVGGIDGASDLTRVTIGGEIIRLSGGDFSAGMTIRLRVRARDVVIALNKVSGVSIRNQLACEINSLSEPKGNQVEVVLSLGDQYLRARLTKEAVEELGLTPGMKVVALIKTMALASG